MYRGIVFHVVCGDLGAVCGSLRWFAAVGIKCEKSRHQRKDAKRAENMRKEPCFMEEKQTLPPVWEIAFHLAVACGVYGDVFLCCPFSHKVSWVRS